MYSFETIEVTNSKLANVTIIDSKNVLDILHSQTESLKVSCTNCMTPCEIQIYVAQVV